MLPLSSVLCMETGLDGCVWVGILPRFRAMGENRKSPLDRAH
jgi:hypothetical protein